MRQRRNHLVLLAFIVAALVGVVMLALPSSPAHKKTRLGLDLQGGLEVVLKAVPPKGQKITQKGLDNAVTIMRNRVDKIGVSEPEIRKQGNDQIVIELPGVKNAKQAADLIGKTAALEFYDLEADLTGPSAGTQGFVRYPVATANLFNLLAGQQAKAKDGTPTAWYLFGKNKRLIAGPADTRDGLFSPKNPRVPKGGKVFAVPAKTVVISCTPTDQNPCPGNAAVGTTYYYLFKYDPTDPNEEKRVPEMTGAELKSTGTQADIDSTTGQPIVTLAFTSKGNKIFQRITKTLYQRGRSWRVGGQTTPQHFAIVLDREIKSFPQIDPEDPQLSNGISGGGRITNIGSSGEAKDLAVVLQTGALPYVFEQLEQTQVSATLGKDSLNQAKFAAAVGLIVVALFLLLFYRFLGVIAVAGLAIYAAFMYGVILLLNVTLTLPGFAGLILTIGVAADANVVVFERIKEEVRSGKSIRAAINAGYTKGLHTIVDANVVTGITALVLFAVATAGVKGFAVMLLIGTVLSLVTAVFATRAMLGLLAGFRWFNNPSFMGAGGQQKGRFLQIDFMGRRNLWFGIAGVVVAISLVSLATKGLNLGIDFKGGTQITFKTDKYVPLSNVRDQTAAIGQSDAVIQGRGSSKGESYKSFQIRTKSLKPNDQETLLQDLESRVGAKAPGVQNVSSSFGRQIARLAILAIIVSLLLIIVYIAVRFEFKFALPVIVALIHDLIITVGVYSLTGSEVTTATVAAVLTVLGYSIYDTIIIFDRIRENIPLMRGSSFATIANVSLWETIRRSLATTFITLLPVVSLYLFGGDTLRTFALALLIGITSGAYSSIFIAAPLLTTWKEREPEYKRLIGSKEIGVGVGGLGGEEPEAPEAGGTPVPAPRAPAPAPALASGPGFDKPTDKREQRRQRRRNRPHGRPR